MNSLSLTRVLGAFAATSLCFAASALNAATFQLTFAQAAGLGSGPYGTVTLTQNGANVDGTVALNSGFNFVKTGALAEQQFTFSGVGVALGDITVDAHTPALVVTTAFAPPGNTSFTGNWNFGINAPSIGNGAPGFNPAISFHVANATIADLTVPNNSGYLFAVDVLNTATGSTGAAVAVGTPTVADGGTTIALLGLGLAALAFARRKLAR